MPPLWLRHKLRVSARVPFSSLGQASRCCTEQATLTGVMLDGNGLQPSSMGARVRTLKI
jgi:hypothetical protein